MRTLLLNLPWQKDNRLGVRAGSRWPFTCLPENDGKIHYVPFPFFLAYATALLKKNSLPAKLLDCIAGEVNEAKLMEEIEDYDPEIIIVETSTPSFKNDLRITAEIKKKFNRLKMVLCGPHATFFCGSILKEYGFVDYILTGEYEYALLNLVNCLNEKTDLGVVGGLTYRQGSKIKINAPENNAEELDSLPWPEREDVPIYRYNDGFCGLPVPNVQMWSSRGCPFKCTFCLWPQTMYKKYKYRVRSASSVADEMQFLINNFNFKAVYFDDDLFNAERGHVVNICKEIRRREIKIPWAAMARADLMDNRLLELMRDSGLYAVKYGIESANREILESCKKNIDLSRAFEMIRFSKKLGIKVHLTFCLGLPGETKESIRQTEAFIDKSEPDSLQVSFATPLPGTEYYDYLKEKDSLLSDDWSDFDGNFKFIVKNQSLSGSQIEKIKNDFDSNRKF